jgi:hypothetical protein
MFYSHLHENTPIIYYEVNSAYGVREIVAVYSENQSKLMNLSFGVLTLNGS